MVANFWPWNSKLDPPSTAVELSPNGHPNDSAPPGNSLRHNRNAVAHLGQSTVFDFSFSLLPQQYPSIRWFLSFEISRILSSKEPAPFIFEDQRWKEKKKYKRLTLEVFGYIFSVCWWQFSLIYLDSFFFSIFILFADYVLI